MTIDFHAFYTKTRLKANEYGFRTPAFPILVTSTHSVLKSKQKPFKIKNYKKLCDNYHEIFGPVIHLKFG